MYVCNKGAVTESQQARVSVFTFLYVLSYARYILQVMYHGSNIKRVLRKWKYIKCKPAVCAPVNGYNESIVTSPKSTGFTGCVSPDVYNASWVICVTPILFSHARLQWYNTYACLYPEKVLIYIYIFRTLYLYYVEHLSRKYTFTNYPPKQNNKDRYKQCCIPLTLYNLIYARDILYTIRSNSIRPVLVHV